MRYLLLFLLPCLLWCADGVDLSGLTPEQVAQVKLQAQELRSQSTSAVIREETKAWAQMGSDLGVALVAAAKQMGIAAAEFANTPLGRFVVVVVFLKILGGKLLVTVAGVGLLALDGYFFWYCRKRIMLTPVYEYKPYLFGLWNRRTIVKYQDQCTSGDFAVTVAVVSIIAAAISVALITIPLANL
jgi:hypothetical protein